MKNKIFVLIAVVASAGLIMAWGCGGKAFEDGGTVGVSGTPVPIILTAGLNGGEAAAGVSKDVTAWGDFGSQGMLESQDEEADAVNCWFTWDALTQSGLRPVITLVTKGNVYAECLTALKDPNNCIGCMNDADPLTPESANLYCEGIVPPSTSDQINAVAHCTFKFSVEDFTVGKARVVEKAWRTVDTMVGWPELDELIYEGGTTSIMDNILDNSIATGSDWDFTLADGNPATETTMSAASDPVHDILPVGGAAVEKMWVKYLDFTAKGSGPTQLIIDTRDIVTPVQFVIPSLPASTYEWNKDRVYISQTFCTNIDEGCDIPEVRSVAASMFSITGVDGITPLVSNATDDFSIITISYLAEPLLAQMTAANYEFDLVSPLPGEDAIATMRTYDDVALKAYIAITDAYKFQQEEFYAVVRNVEIMSGGQILSLAAPYVLEHMKMACAGSDVFKLDSLSPCYMSLNGPIESDLTLAEAIAADLVVHVPDASLLDPELGKIAFDGSKFSGGDAEFSFGKSLVKQSQAGASSYITTKFDSITGFDSFTSLAAGEKDAMYVMLYDSVNAIGVGYGIEAYNAKVAHVSTVTADVDFEDGDLITGTVNGAAIAQVDCTGLAHLACITAVAGQIKANADISEAEVNINDDNVIDVTGLDVGETITIVLTVTDNDPVLTQATVSGPFDLRKDLVGFAYDSNAALRKFTSGARMELADTSVSLRLVTGKNNADMNVQALLGGQWTGFTDVIYEESIAYDAHYPQDVGNGAVGKTLIVPALSANSTTMVFFFDSLDANTLVDILDNTLINYYIVDQVIGPTQMGMFDG